MNRLQEIESEIEKLRPMIWELHAKVKLSNNERWEIIKSNCIHKFEDYDFDRFDEENMYIPTQEEICNKCGLIRRKEDECEERQG